MNLRLGCHDGCVRADECQPLANGLHATLASGKYDWPASILRLDDLDSYLAVRRTLRKRAHRAEKLGYRATTIRRADHADEIHAINTSKPERQGRPMADSYRRRPQFELLPSYSCARHRIDEYGVLDRDSTLVAYLVLYACGDIALISQILGHADHLANDIMYLLIRGAFQAMLERAGPLVVFYNRHDSGTDGLRFFKERLGFSPERVEWQL